MTKQQKQAFAEWSERNAKQAANIMDPVHANHILCREEYKGYIKCANSLLPIIEELLDALTLAKSQYFCTNNPAEKTIESFNKKIGVGDDQSTNA